MLLLRLQREYNDIIDKALGQNNLENWAIEGNEDVINAANYFCDHDHRRFIC